MKNEGEALYWETSSHCHLLTGKTFLRVFLLKLKENSNEMICFLVLSVEEIKKC